MQTVKALSLQTLNEASEALDKLIAELESGELVAHEVSTAMAYGEVLYKLCQGWHFGKCSNEGELQYALNKSDVLSTQVPALWGWRGDFVMWENDTSAHSD